MVNTWRDSSGRICHDDSSYLRGTCFETPKEREERERKRAQLNREMEARHMHNKAEQHRRGPSANHGHLFDYDY